MNSIWINRALIALSAVGIAIAGSLTFFEMNNLMIPCGGTLGCLFVRMHDSSKLGGVVSVSYIGLAGYVLLFAIGVARTILGERKCHILNIVGAIGAFVGFAFSGYLMYMSFAVIGQKCIWCIASFATITLMAILHAGLIQFGPAKKLDQPIGSMLAAGALILSLGFVGWKVSTEKRSADIFMAMVVTEGVTVEQALPDLSKVRGDANAKVTVLEFADMNCPTCRMMHPDINKIVEKGGVRFAYRHYPLIQLPGHETSVRAALIAEYAATQGKFWEYLDIVFAPKNTLRAQSHAGLLAMAGEIGLDKAELKKILAGEGGEELLESLADDDKLQRQMMIPFTPTFIIFAEGVKTIAVDANNLEETLNSSPYKSLIRKGR